MARHKISAPYREFIKAINSLLKLDHNNQLSFSKQAISHKQLVLLTEGLFFTTFKTFECYLEEIFLLYTLEKPTILNRKPRSYLKPKNFEHAFELIKAQLRFVDWQNPDNVITRAETYLENGEPIKTPLSSERVLLNQMRKVRNRIAHTSRESLKEYRKVLLEHYGVIPLKIPKPGEFLLNTVPNSNPPIHYLVFYLKNLKSIAEHLAH